MHLQEKLTVTWKVHCVTAHLSSFLSMHGRGMADVCEQVGDAAHHAMKPVLQSHKVAEDNPKYGKRQLKAVVEYSSWNVFNMTGTKRLRKRKDKSVQ